jgi:hypothetical protein
MRSPSSETVSECEGASERARGRIERGKDAVTRRLDETAVEPLDLVPRRLVVSIEDLAPIPIPQGSRAARRVDDVREQDGGQHPIHVLSRVERSDLLLRPRV